MPSTVKCPHCQVELAIPEGGVGRRLKCPQCHQIFQAVAVQSGNAAADASRPKDKRSPAAPTKSQTPTGSVGPRFLDEDIPRAEGPLRDILDIPLLDDTPRSEPSGRSAPLSDAAALFQDDIGPRRKKLAGEARQQARRCSACGGVVPVGMSICATCGLDQETGSRIGLADEIETVSSGPRRAAMPAGVLVVGILALAASLGLSIASLVGWQNGLDGAQFLLVVCLFGVFASVEFLRRRSVKLLMVALTLGVMVDVVAMIAIPVYNAVTDVEVVDASRPDGEEEKDIRPVNDLLDENRVMWGISLLVVYAATAVYLNSPAVRRCFERR